MIRLHHQQFVTVLFHPHLLAVYLLRKLPLSVLFPLRVAVDGVDRPYYAYGLYHACREAKSLGIKRISTIEFGVAGGHGLVQLERLAQQMTEETGVAIDVYGFDIGIGLPTPADYRDAPHIWKKGFYKMDQQALKKKLKKTTQLVIGDVGKTVKNFMKKDFAPLGFISFDLDYYTSTMDAFNIFNVPDNKLLPRVFCYFDDVIGNDNEMLSEYVGELLAIKEFNQSHKNKKIDSIKGLTSKRVIKSTWASMMYIMHTFDHKLYNQYIYELQDRQSDITKPLPSKR